MSTILVVLTLLACWRVARLLTVDFIFDRPRRWAAGTEPDAEPGDGQDLRPTIGYLVTCPWCMSIWTSPPLVAAAVLWPLNNYVLIGLFALAASGVTGILTVVEARLDR